MRVSAIQAFDDNYIWLLHNDKFAVVVDPGDEEPVLERLGIEGLQLKGILITHKHGDHVGGVKGLLAAYPDIPVYGPLGERIALVTHPLQEGAVVSLPELGVQLQVLETPGHTEGHLSYYRDGILFCGDTLFSAGCGRVFSGTHEQLHNSLQRLTSLPEQTLCYCAHEYTQANLGFAKWVEPQSDAIAQREEQVRLLRADGAATVPSLLSTELAVNPFLRVGVPAVVGAAERYAGRRLERPVEVFTALRNWKDREYD